MILKLTSGEAGELGDEGSLVYYEVILRLPQTVKESQLM